LRDRRLHAVADRHLDVSLVVFQFGELDRRLALAADVDERALGPDRDNRALDRLPGLEALRFDRGLEHRGKIVLRLAVAHGSLLFMVTSWNRVLELYEESRGRLRRRAPQAW
jgi:hypothetical protein